MSTTNSTRVQAPNLSLDDIVPDDVAPLNPPGRDAADDSSVERRTKKHKINKKISQPFHTSTYNVRSLVEEWKQWELVCKAKAFNIPVIALQEHRIKNTSTIMRDGYKFLLAPPPPKSKSLLGLGFLLSPWAQRCYIEHNIVSNRIMSISFTGDVCTHIVTCHSPTNVSTDLEIDHFYNELSTCAQSFPPHDLVVIAGDLNAHLGRDTCNTNAYYESSNRNGQRLLDFAQENGFTIAGLKFNKKSSKKVTWIAPNGQLHQNDHILIRSKWQNSLKNCESYIKPSVQSDHRIVTATIKLSVRANIERPKVIKYDWEKLKGDPATSTAFHIQLNNRFSKLENTADEESDDIELCNQHAYTNMITAINDTAEEILPKRKTSSLSAQILSNPEYIAAVKVRDAAVKASHLRKTRAATKALRQATLKVREVETGIQEAFVNDAIDKIDQQFLSKPNDNNGYAAWQTKSNSSGIAWKLINDLTNRKPKSTAPLPGYRNKAERAKAWTDHYSKLLYNPVDTIKMDNITTAKPELPICTGPFSVGELEVALKQTKDTYGHDGIPSLLYKCVDLKDILLPIFNNMLATGKAPQELLVTAILPIPKGAKKFCPENSRGISILPVATKVYNRLLLNRISSHIEPRLRYNQNGFRPGRGTREHILALRRIIEEAINHQLPCVISFIDFSKAFDSIFRSHLPNILASYGIPVTIIKAIMSLYMNTKAKVMTPEGITLEFLTNLGILQGDVLAPLIFIIVLDFILRLAIGPRDGFKVGTDHIADFDFADDIATVTDSIAENTRLCQSISDIAAQYGLLINIDKTKYMFYNIPRPVPSEERVFVNGKALEEVSDFKYLGSYIASTSRDINIRKGLAWKALQSLDAFWKSNMSRKIKTKIFRTAVEPVLLYGAETWTLKKADTRALDGTYTRMLRRVFGISWKSHTPNAVLYGSIPPVTETIKTRRLRFAGHVYRLQDQPAQQLLFWQPSYGKRYQGRPHKTFPDVLQEDTGLEPWKIRMLMSDRDKWRDAVSTNSFQSTNGST